jgi:hypothetical protein
MSKVNRSLLVILFLLCGTFGCYYGFGHSLLALIIGSLLMGAYVVIDVLLDQLAGKRAPDSLRKQWNLILLGIFGTALLVGTIWLVVMIACGKFIL